MIRFFVPGIPQPGGSKRGFFIKKLQRVVITDDNKKAAPWKQQVAFFAKQAHAGAPLAGPLHIQVVFQMPRPRSHYGTGRMANMVKPSAPRYPTTKPDATKLLRSTEDALTGIIWQDDAQIVSQRVVKMYHAEPGALIQIEELTC